jgi:aspartyl-tRNA(Asn)/glutamyl-tRNA(Gln) amidotransferase subunit C
MSTVYELTNYGYNEQVMGKVSKEEVKNIALLARLELTDKEYEKYQAELSDILSYIDLINKVDTKKVDPTAQVTGLTDVVRGDVKTPSSLKRDEMFVNTPDKKDGYIKVKAVLE